MEITKTGEQAQKEVDKYNRFVYRRMKAHKQGYVCPECGKSHWTPNVLTHHNYDDYYYLFKCVECGCEWKSNTYKADWSRVERLQSENSRYIRVGDLIVLAIEKYRLRRKFKQEMEILEEGYEPSINYIIKEQETFGIEEGKED